MRVWVYRFEVIDGSEEQEAIGRLNELGSQGWECYQIERYAMGFTRQFRCWLRRPGPPIDPAQAEVA
jgi:hypothetical protein